MKTTQKLNLNKSTIINLDDQSADKVKGGAGGSGTSCTHTGYASCKTKTVKQV